MPEDYLHRAAYYETDQMGCVHHSNYIRWMEEARVHMMNQAGHGYKALEEAGIISPVLEVNCQYKAMVRFDDLVAIHVWLSEYDGIRMTIEYEIRDAVTKDLKTLGRSRHCFLSSSGKPLSLKRSYPEWDTFFSELLTYSGAKTLKYSRKAEKKQ